MKSDEEFLKGIYEKAAALQNAPEKEQAKSVRTMNATWSRLAVAACFCILVAVAAVSGGRLARHGEPDKGKGVSSADYEATGEDMPIQSRMVEQENENPGIAAMSLNRESYVHGTVQTLAELTEADKSYRAYVDLQLTDGTGSLRIYVTEADGWNVGEEVWLFVEMNDTGAYLRTATDKYVLGEDGKFYNAAGTVFENNEE